MQDHRNIVDSRCAAQQNISSIYIDLSLDQAQSNIVVPCTSISLGKVEVFLADQEHTSPNESSVGKITANSEETLNSKATELDQVAEVLPDN